MANPYLVSFTLMDSNGVKTSTPAYYRPTTPASVTVANLLTDANGLGSALDNATNAQIVGARIEIPMDILGTWKTAPVAENDNSDVIVLNFNNAVTKYATEYLLPAFLQAMLNNGNVDLSNVVLTALYDFILSGTLHGEFTNQATQELSSLRDAFQTDRKSRKLRSKSIATP